MLDRSDVARVFVSGPAGPAGESAYQVWLSQGNVGSKKFFLDSLKAKDGRDGQPGAGTIVTRIAAVALLASTAVVSLDGVTCLPADPSNPDHFGKVIGLVAAPTAQGAFATAMTFGPLAGIAGEFTAGDALYIADGTGAVHKGGLTRHRPSAPAWFQSVGCALSASDVTFQLGGFASRQSEGAPDLGGSRVFFDRGDGTDSSDVTDLVNGVPITPTGGTAGSSLADIARRVLTPHDFLAVSDAVINSDKTATASRSAAANTILLQNYFNYCRDKRLPWVLPHGDWLVDAGIKAYGPGIAYGRILAPNDGRVQPGLNDVWGAPFTVSPYPEDILIPPTLAEVKTWTGVKRGSSRIVGLNGRKDQYITVLTADQILVDRRDKFNTAENITDFVAPPMNLGEGFLVTSDDGQIAFPLIEDWRTATWTEANTTITAQRTRAPIDVVLPDVVLIAPAFVNAEDLQGRRSGIQFHRCNVNARGGSVTNLVPSVPPLQGFARSNCCNVIQTGARVFSLGSLSTQYGFMQNLACGIQDIGCSAIGCRRGYDATRGKDALVDGGFYPDGMGAHYLVRAHIKNVSLISCRTAQNPVPLNFAGGDLTIENCNIVVPPGFDRAFQMRADLWKWVGKIHFKGCNIFFDAGDATAVKFLNLQGPAVVTGYNTGIVTEMPDSIIVDRATKIRVGGTKSDGTPSNARLQYLIMFNDWDDAQNKDQIVGGRIELAAQISFDNPAPLPGRTVPSDPSDMDSSPVVIGAGFPKCKIEYTNARRSIGGTYDMVVEGAPDLHTEILCDRAGPKAAGRVNLTVRDVRGQKLISSTFGGTRKTHIQTRETETVTFETPGFASGFAPVGEENSNRTYDETQIGTAYGGDVTAAKAMVDGAQALLPDLFAKRAYATPLTRAVALLAGVAAGVTSFTTQGYAAPGDGGGATYVEEASGYVATALDIVVGGRKFRNASFELRLQMAGSKGDGSAIDRDTWNAVFALGRPVRIVGEHRLDNDVTLPNGATLIADPGKGILTAGTSGTVLSVNVRSDITISGVWFKGRMDGPALAGIAQFANCKNLRIDGRCRFSDHKYTALSIINGINCSVDRIEVYRCGYHNNVNDVSPAVAFFQSLTGTGLTSATEMELWRFNRQNSFTHNYLEECYGCKVAGQFGFTGDHNTMYGRGLVSPGFGNSHNSHSSFCHNNISSGKYGGAAIDSLVSYRCKYNDNVFWECAGAGLLIANSTDDVAANNYCLDNWQSCDVDPVQYPGNGPSLHRGGIVIDCDTTKLNPTVARLRLVGNVCRNTKPEASQQNGLQIRNPATMDIASWVIDDSNDFSGNAGPDVTPPYDPRLERSLASAATTSLGGVPNKRVVITGTTAITSLGAVPNRTSFVRFAGSLTLTHNATSLILPGAANIVTQAGDTAIAISDGSGNWRLYDYQRADGSAGLGFSQIDHVTTSQTVLKPSWARYCNITAVGPGGGGGGARRGAAGSNRHGGGGGGAGAISTETFATSEIGTSLTVTIGAPGLGAAPVTTDNTNGAAGGNGGATFVNDGNVYDLVRANGGSGGGGGTDVAAGAAGAAGTPSGEAVGAGGAAGTGGALGSGGGSGARGSGGGGSGGGLTSANVPSTGRNGGGGYAIAQGRDSNGGTLGAVGANGGAGQGKRWARGASGGGGGGGAADGSSAGGSGGAGGAPGGGGGGGGASVNGAASGGGGDGGRGEVWIVWRA